MNEKIARILLMDYLYDEISAADKEKLGTYLQEHPEMQQELDELQTTRSLLQQAPKVEPDKKLMIVESHDRSFSEWWNHAIQLLPHSIWAKTALATTACLVFLLIAASAANLQIHSTQNGFAVHLGYASQPQTAELSKAQTEAIIRQVRKENTAILTEYADMLNKHNKQQLQQVVKYFEQQRLNDLQLVNKSLEQIQQKNNYQIEQTNQVLGQVLQTIASNDQ